MFTTRLRVRLRGAKLEQELESVDIGRRFIDLGDLNSQPAWRTGDHVLMLNLKTWRKNAGSSTFVSCIDGARLSDFFCGLATISALEPVAGVQHRPVKLVVHVQPLTPCCNRWVRGTHSPGISNWDQSLMAHLRELMETESMLPGNSGTCWLEVLPSLRVSCPNARGLVVWDRGPKASVWPDCGVGIGRPEHARQARMMVEQMRSWRRFRAYFLGTPGRLSPCGERT